MKRELNDFKQSDVVSLLVWAFRVCKENAGAFDPTAGRGSASPLDRALSLKEAAKVVAYVDRQLTEEERAVIRFMFAREGDAAESLHFNLVHNWLWKTMEDRFDFSSEDRCANTSLLRLLVPHEVRHRIITRGERMYTERLLCDFVGVPKTSFRRVYKADWEGMIMGVNALCSDAFGKIDHWCQSLLEGRGVLLQPVVLENISDDNALVESEIARYMELSDVAEKMC